MGLSRDDFVIAICKVASSTVAIVCVALKTPTLVAGLVLPPTGGTPLLTIPSGDFIDDVRIQLLNNGHYVTPNVTGSFSGSFYGAPVKNLWISDNGNLNFDGERDTPSSFNSEAFTALSRTDKHLIAPFWDDFIFLDEPRNQILDQSRIGDYLAVTWRDAFLFNDFGDAKRITTQVVWFERKMTVNGFDFEKDDIAFGYSGNSNAVIDATIGVSRGTGEGMFTSIPGDDDIPFPDGAISSSQGQSNLIPWDANEFLLFRPNANGTSYDGYRKLFSAVPEPTSIFVALSWVVLAFAKWRRQIFAHMVIRKTS